MSLRIWYIRWEDVVTEFNNPERKEYIAAMKELDEALGEQRRLQEKHFPVTAIGPGTPMKTGEVLTEAAFSEIERVERRVKEAHERMNRAQERMQGNPR